MAEYIDRDKVLDAVFELPPKMDAQGYGWIARGGLYQLLRDFPSADVQPVKHGRWEERDCGFDVECKCSVCGYKDFILTKQDRYWFNRNYCPNCGADMREKS